MISPTGTCSRHPTLDNIGAFAGTRPGVRQAGFTLIEVMVVVLLIGIITSFAMLSLKTDRWEEELQRQLQRLTALVSAGSEQAVIRSEELAILFDDDSYSFMVLRNKEWQPIADDRLLRQRMLPKGISLRLKVEDLDLQFGEEDDKSKQPMVLLLSSGEITPFSVTLTADKTGAKYKRSWNLMGELEPDSDAKKR
ncbi:MAG: type II secretion system minor pseudopilin GspH [Gammaproteobacteria bacterium]